MASVGEFCQFFSSSYKEPKMGKHLIIHSVRPSVPQYQNPEKRPQENYGAINFIKTDETP